MAAAKFLYWYKQPRQQPYHSDFAVFHSDCQTIQIQVALFEPYHEKLHLVPFAGIKIKPRHRLQETYALAGQNKTC